jgi:hypothetical protein
MSTVSVLSLLLLGKKGRGMHLKSYGLHLRMASNILLGFNVYLSYNQLSFMVTLYVYKFLIVAI